MATQMIPQFTPAGRQFITFLGTYNSGDRNAIIRWITDHFSEAMLARQPVDLRVPYFLSLYGQTGRLRIRGIEDNEDLVITVNAYATTTEQDLCITLRVEPDVPHRISELSIR